MAVTVYGVPMKLRVWQEIEITEDGVGPVWRWSCPECEDIHGITLFWENSIRSVQHHISYHKAKAG